MMFADSNHADSNWHNEYRWNSPKAEVTTWLWNRAVEEQGSGVKVRTESQRWSNGSASCVWRPDSVR